MDEIARAADAGPKKTDGIEFNWNTVPAKPVEPKPVEAKPVEAKPVKAAEPTTASDKAAPAIKPQPGSGINFGWGKPADSAPSGPLPTKIAPVSESKPVQTPALERPDPTKIQFGWGSRDTAPVAPPADTRTPAPEKLGGAGAPTDRTSTADRSAGALKPGTVELSYKDPDFDKKLWSGSYDAMKITDLPKGVEVSSWADKDGFYIWFKGGNDNRKPHYVPPSIKTIEADGGVRNADEMRLKTRMAEQQEGKGSVINFEKMYGKENPLQFAQRMGNISADLLARHEDFLRKEIAKSPNDPMAHFLLSDVLLGQAFKPIIEQVASGSSKIRMNTPYTEQHLDEAIKFRQKGMDIMKREGLTFPNPPIVIAPYDRQGQIHSALGLYPNWWGDLQLKVLKTYIKAMPEIELPPILPPG